MFNENEVPSEFLVLSIPGEFLHSRSSLLQQLAPKKHQLNSGQVVSGRNVPAKLSRLGDSVGTLLLSNILTTVPP